MRGRGLQVSRLASILIALFLGLVATAMAVEPSRTLDEWPAWRGPLATGVAPQANPPVRWSAQENVRWKTAVPGRGHSTPIVWGDRVFLTSAEPIGKEFPPRYSQAPGTHDGIPVKQAHRFQAFALNRSDGTIVWQRNLLETIPHEGGHHSGSLASNSMVTDGERVWAFFGSYGLYCLDMNGQVLWKASFGEMQTKHGHGEGCSPVLVDDLVIINWDHEGDSFITALDQRTGRPRWKKERPEETSWSTPIVIEHAGQRQLIVSGTNRIRAYDPASGNVIWECGGLSSNVVASPVAANGMAYFGSSYESRALLAIRLEGARGDITGTKQVVWSRTRATPYVPSPLLYDDALYFISHYQGILTRVHGPTGEDAPGSLRLVGLQSLYASPVAAAGRIYVTDLEGTTLVLSHGDVPRPLALNKLDEPVSASAAIAGRQIFLRGEKHLYCLEATIDGE